MIKVSGKFTLFAFTAIKISSFLGDEFSTSSYCKVSGVPNLLQRIAFTKIIFNKISVFIKTKKVQDIIDELGL